ncbi:MAG: tyrosine--tRNA ligase [Candidatus Moranbacteria bacterium]|nr:tyrosine--tRNA ligase [Candidatus Moranbacteria bacterium]
MKIDTSKAKINDILSRSVAQILPSKEKMEQVLSSTKRLRIYIGADATGPQLHLGHATNFMMLERLRKLGHEVIVLFGDFTAMIGDPTDKNAARTQLSKKEVEKNIKTWMDQVRHIVDFDDKENPARVVKNSAWLAKLDFEKMVELASSFTVQQMLERDMFEKRIKEEKPIYVHEFFYPLLQGYDSVALDVDVEIGGTDQTFNMLAGRTLQKKYNNHEKFVIATTLLEDPETRKKLMSKSEGNYVALNDTPRDMFGKIMALKDGVIGQMFVDCTDIPLKDAREIASAIERNTINPRDAKVRLAKEVVTIYHSKEEAEKAEQFFVETFSQKVTPTDIPEVHISEDSVSIVDFLIGAGLAKSRSDARRKIEQGGVELDNTKIIDYKEELQRNHSNKKVLKVGKKDFVKIIFV